MRTALTTVTTLLALLPAACAHTPEHSARGHREPTPVVAEAAAPTQPAEPIALPPRRPDAAYQRRSEWGRRAMAHDQAVTIPFDEHGMTYPDLLALVAREAAVRIRFQPSNALVRNLKVTMVGPTRVARGDLIAWLQDTCAYDGLFLAPHGPADRNEYAVTDMANATLTTLAVSVSEDDLPALAGRNGLYVTCVLTVPDGLDASRVRQALAQHSTKTAGLGRINDFDKTTEALMVADFASVVAIMRRALDDMAIRRYELSQ